MSLWGNGKGRDESSIYSLYQNKYILWKEIKCNRLHATLKHILDTINGKDIGCHERILKENSRLMPSYGYVSYQVEFLKWNY